MKITSQDSYLRKGLIAGSDFVACLIDLLFNGIGVIARCWHRQSKRAAVQVKTLSYMQHARGSYVCESLRKVHSFTFSTRLELARLFALFAPAREDFLSGKKSGGSRRIAFRCR